jgi:hypothetical protein
MICSSSVSQEPSLTTFRLITHRVQQSLVNLDKRREHNHDLLRSSVLERLGVILVRTTRSDG